VATDVEAAAEAVMRDVEATVPGLVLFGPVEDDNYGTLRGLMLWAVDGSGTLVSLVGQSYATKAEAAELVAADVQEVVTEALWSLTGEASPWPECPRHPNTHPLRPEVVEGEAAWCCPMQPRPVVAAVGTLRRDV
jgi:hypothetical protein